MIGGAAWSPASLACGTEDYISSICAMSAVTLRDFGNQFMQADGRILQVSSYAALYALIGTTYGSQGPAAFMIPDLRGRTIIGAGRGPGLPNYAIGEYGGNTSFTLTVAELPPHVHSLNAPVDISKMTAVTSLSGLSASITGAAKLKGSSAAPSANDPSGNYMATTAGLTNKIYTSSTPTVEMNAGSIDTSGLSVGNVTGNATTTLGGTATVTGTTGATGTGQAVYSMPPYVAMKYYIAATGLFPSND